MAGQRYAGKIVPITGEGGKPSSGYCRIFKHVSAQIAAADMDAAGLAWVLEAGLAESLRFYRGA